MSKSKKKNRSETKLLLFLTSFIYALLLTVPFFGGTAYMMTVKTIPDAIVSTAGTVLLAIFAFLFTLITCKRVKKQKGVVACITLVTTFIIFVALKFFMPSSAYDTSFFIKLGAICIGALIGLLLSSGYGKKRR